VLTAGLTKRIGILSAEIGPPRTVRRQPARFHRRFTVVCAPAQLDISRAVIPRLRQEVAASEARDPSRATPHVNAGCVVSEKILRKVTHGR